MPKLDTVERKWWLVNADGRVLGRLASEIAKVLAGKGRLSFAPHIDGGDFVICINAGKVRVTGRKRENKVYYRHSGYPHGFRKELLDDMLEKRPERVILLAVKGMLPRNRIGRQMLTRLKVYRGADHPHKAQRPQVLDL